MQLLRELRAVAPACFSYDGALRSAGGASAACPAPQLGRRTSLSSGTTSTEQPPDASRHSARLQHGPATLRQRRRDTAILRHCDTATLTLRNATASRITAARHHRATGGRRGVPGSQAGGRAVQRGGRLLALSRPPRLRPWANTAYGIRILWRPRDIYAARGTAAPLARTLVGWWCGPAGPRAVAVADARWPQQERPRGRLARRRHRPCDRTCETRPLDTGRRSIGGGPLPMHRRGHQRARKTIFRRRSLGARNALHELHHTPLGSTDRKLFLLRKHSQ
jgi:hypothetical protein